jgi:UDP-N-acetylmuramyl pentapeptide phosphotransferase/UDP-N-acetylglucosamine-1-phosphate transferase
MQAMCFGRLGIKDIPNERSLHTEITKKSGGMVFIPLFLVSALFWIYLHPDSFPATAQEKLLLLGSLFFCLLGFLDDIYHLSPNIRLLLEFSVSFVIIYFLSPTITLFGHMINDTATIIFMMGFFARFHNKSR